MFKSFVALSVLGLLGTSCAPNAVTTAIASTESAEMVLYSYEKTWNCPECTPEEKYILSQLQKNTNIRDRNALATILGNIKQESNFRANVCEGGARVPYDRCYRGGYGIIQWTSPKRYNGLGMFAKKYDCDPSELTCQTRYMINENVFQKHLPTFEGSGQSVSYYMKPAYRWLGWGIKGKRETYAYNYSKKLVLS